MFDIRLLSWWIIEGESLARLLHIFGLLNAGDSGVDIVGQPPEHIPTDPNALTVALLISRETLDLIEADPDYRGAVLSVVEIEEVI